MENKILQGYLHDFQQDFGFSTKLEVSELFEHFSNYCLLSRIHPEAFHNDNLKIEEIKIGGGQDSGIDGAAIVVNDHIVFSKDEIDSLKDSLQKLEVKFVFIQSKTSPQFKGSDISNFIFGVKDFFRDEPSLLLNEDVKALRRLKSHIYNNSILMEKSPVCQLYYVTTGTWGDDANLVGRINQEVSELRNSNLFSQVNFTPVDAPYLERLYKELKNKVTKEINFEKNTPLPRIDGVQEAYIGILPIKEFISLISDSEGNLQRNLFYDNVRDFQGNNSVNLEIAQTIQDAAEQVRFPIFNNGVTIVSKSLNKVGTYYKIKDFQIVNGCQTSHIIFNNKEKIDQHETYLPVKLIVSDNQDVINKIIKATNRQTEVKVEAFESLKQFHKTLQAFYDSFPKDSKLYYERRPREYDSVFPAIPRARIMTLATQINASISMFWNEPHSTHRYYGELLKAYSNRIFKQEHQPILYYTSAFCLYKIDSLLKQRELHPKYRSYKYHLLTVFRILSAGFIFPNFSSKNIIKYCEQVLDALSNDQKSKLLLLAATKCIDDSINIYQVKHGKPSNEYVRLKDFTVEVIDQAKKMHKSKEYRAVSGEANIS